MENYDMHKFKSKNDEVLLIKRHKYKNNVKRKLELNNVIIYHSSYYKTKITLCNIYYYVIIQSLIMVPTLFTLEKNLCTSDSE